MNANWSTIARKIHLLYDSVMDFNPQFDGYNLSIVIKQADVVLLGYPLRYANMQASTRRNNLKFYANVTRETGPAMTWSMHAIGNLNEEIDVDEHLFNRTFRPYIRRPFYVWNEYVNGVDDGASNFITGAGGFLQLIMYGYAGIRINVDSLSVTRPTLPPRTNRLKMNGQLCQCEIHIDKIYYFFPLLFVQSIDRNFIYGCSSGSRNIFQHLSNRIGRHRT